MTRGARLQVSKSNGGVKDENGIALPNNKIALPTGLLTTYAPTSPIDSALNDVQVQLVIAKGMFEQRGDGGKLGAYNSILSVIDFFVSQGFPRAILDPLSSVAEAMVDADRGASNPLLQRREGRIGSPPASIGQLIMEGQLAVITECCVRDCQRGKMRPFVEPGTQLANRLIREAKWATKPSAVQLREIRERVHRLVGKKSEDRLIYDMLMNSEEARLDPLRFAKQLLKNPNAFRQPDNFL
ncbi:hypothetical protein [Sphingorhabdus sp.]|jgi:hypothetical protein|uniref:hypothetical protein n=1 Tax=Sphingorhabdus sp. TaxID=1902408 RepID=UPI0037CB7555